MLLKVMATGADPAHEPGGRRAQGEHHQVGAPGILWVVTCSNPKSA